MVARIDVHHHLVAPRYIPMLRDMDVLAPRIAEIMNENCALDDMDEAGVGLSINSVTVPGELTREERISYSRENNEFMARLAVDYPDRFGMFASLPLPDIDATLNEIEYAFDVLKADGAHMITSYEDRWLGACAGNGEGPHARRWSVAANEAGRGVIRER